GGVRMIRRPTDWRVQAWEPRLLVTSATLAVGTLERPRRASLTGAVDPVNSQFTRRESMHMAFELPDLPYPKDALEPHVDARTMEINHDKHHAAYTSNLNAAVEKHSELQGKSAEEDRKSVVEGKR